MYAVNNYFIIRVGVGGGGRARVYAVNNNFHPYSAHQC